MNDYFRLCVAMFINVYVFIAVCVFILVGWIGNSGWSTARFAKGCPANPKMGGRPGAERRGGRPTDSMAWPFVFFAL